MILAVDSATTPTALEINTMTATIAAPATTTVADTAAAIVPNVAAPTPTSAQEIRLDSLENRILTLESEGRATRSKVASTEATFAATVVELKRDFASLVESIAKHLAGPNPMPVEAHVPSKGELAATPEAPLYVSEKAKAKAAAKAAAKEAVAPAKAPPPPGAKFVCKCGGWAVNAVNSKGVEWASKHQKPGCKVTAL